MHNIYILSHCAKYVKRLGLLGKYRPSLTIWPKIRLRYSHGSKNRAQIQPYEVWGWVGLRLPCPWAPLLTKAFCIHHQLYNLGKRLKDNSSTLLFMLHWWHFEQLPSWWEGNHQNCCSVFPRDIWFCHSTYNLAMSASGESAETKLSSNGGQNVNKLFPCSILWMSVHWLFSVYVTGMQDCWRPEIFKEIEWAADNKSTKGYLPASSRTREGYYWGDVQLHYLFALFLPWICLVTFILGLKVVMIKIETSMFPLACLSFVIVFETWLRWSCESSNF